MKAAATVIAALLAGTAFAGPLEDADIAAGRGDHATAVRLWRSVSGQPEAQYSLGLAHETGEGVAQDDREAVRWYTRAAESGYPEAQFRLGLLHANGRGVAADPVQAYVWFTLAATQTLDEGVQGRAATARDQLAQQLGPDQLAAAQRHLRGWRPRQTGAR